MLCVVKQLCLQSIAVSFNVFKKIDDTFTHHLVIDKTSLFYGKEESVPVIEGLYNFHSHPVEAYERKKTKFAWPSAGDYVGFLKAVVKYDTILHIVSYC